MNYLDFIFIGLLIWAAVSGLIKGLVLQLAMLVALFTGVWCAVSFSVLLSGWLCPFLKISPAMAHIISFGLILILVMVLIFWFGSVLNQMINTTVIGIVNRIAGLVFSLLKTILLISVVLVFIDRLPLIPQLQKEKSLLYKPLVSIAPALFPALRLNSSEEQITPLDKNKASETFI